MRHAIGWRRLAGRWSLPVCLVPVSPLSAEELQALNERRHTVNSDLNLKVKALDRANSDLQYLFESTPLATVLLDQALQIRFYVPAATDIFNILPRDRGRPLTDLASRVAVPDLSSDIAAVLSTGQVVEPTPDKVKPNPHLLVRLAPDRGVDDRVDGVAVTFIDISTLIRSEKRHQVLIDELLHRTRNLLAVVRNIARQTLENGGSVDTFSDRLSARGRVQSLVTRAATGAVDLRDIIVLELEAHGALGSGQVTIAGPPVPLCVGLVQTFALAIHELATHAVKHGALGVVDARLSVQWHIAPQADGGRDLVLDWIESGVTVLATAAQRRGFGRELIERALTFDVQARTHLDLAPGGATCRIEVSLEGAG